MILVDDSDFRLDAFIPNIRECAFYNDLIALIVRYQRQCLEVTLGNCLYKELKEQFEYDESAPENVSYAQKWKLKDDADEKWSWLVYGHSYTEDDKQNEIKPFWNFNLCGCRKCKRYEWKGLVSSELIRVGGNQNNPKVVEDFESLIVNYIHYYWSQLTETLTTITGEQVANLENLERVTNRSKRIWSYNIFVSQVQELDYGGRVGLYHFLSHFAGLFPEWQGQCLGYKSVW